MVFVSVNHSTGRMKKTPTIKVTSGDDGTCTVDWTGQFNPDGADDETAKKIIAGIYTAGLSALKKRFGHT